MDYFSVSNDMRISITGFSEMRSQLCFHALDTCKLLKILCVQFECIESVLVLVFV